MNLLNGNSFWEGFVTYCTLIGHTFSGVSILSECKAHTQTKEKQCLNAWNNSNV